MLIKGKAPFADGCATVISIEAAKSFIWESQIQVKPRVQRKRRSQGCIKAKATRLLKFSGKNHDGLRCKKEIFFLKGLDVCII